MADAFEVFLKYQGNETPHEAILALQKIRRGIIKAAADASVALAFEARDAGKQAFIAGGGDGAYLPKVRITKATARKPRTLIRDQGWVDASLNQLVHYAGERAYPEQGQFAMIPQSAKYKAAGKVKFALQYGFLARMVSGKFGLFMRTGMKQKKNPKRDAIELLYTLKPIELARNTQAAAVIVASDEARLERQFDSAMGSQLGKTWKS